MSPRVSRLGTGLAIFALGTLAEAQTVPPGALQQLDTLVGNRAETVAILGTQSGPSGGTYASNVNDAQLEIFKVTGRGGLAGLVARAPSRAEELRIAQASGPASAELVARGRELFNDAGLSAERRWSCASCHPSEGHTDNKTYVGVTVVADGDPSGRSTPTLWGAGFRRAYSWVGTAASLEANIRGIIEQAAQAMWEYVQKAGTTEKLTDDDMRDLVEFLKIL